MLNFIPPTKRGHFYGKFLPHEGEIASSRTLGVAEGSGANFELRGGSIFCLKEGLYSITAKNLVHSVDNSSTYLYVTKNDESVGTPGYMTNPGRVDLIAFSQLHLKVGDRLNGRISLGGGATADRIVYAGTHSAIFIDEI